MRYAPESFLTEKYLQARRGSIGGMAQRREAASPVPGGTVYLAAADDRGNMISFIQSNYAGFGSGLVVPSTGIALQNRGRLFSLDPQHPNVLAPGKRPYHTIIPGFLTHHGRPVGPFGVMGGYMQPQGHVQLLRNVLDCHMNPQAALDAPRFYWHKDNTVIVEGTMPPDIIEALRRRGHDVQVATDDASPFGRGQVLWRLDNGVLMGATEPRADGMIACW
jgi:gamma-glutamyltranspeptidase/glutathione hydrolase